MPAALRFLVVRRPGVYNTHSHVIQPMEHTLVNDGLPLLFKQFKVNVTKWSKIYLPHCKSIDFEDISLEEADEYIRNPQQLKDDFDGATILLNHPKQYKLASFNMQQLYVAVSNDKWQLTPSTLKYFGGSEYISTCLDYTNDIDNSHISDDSKWMKYSNQDLLNKTDITLRRTFKKYEQYITYLRNDILNRELILFHSNHLSVPLSRQLRKIIINWQPDTLLLESDAIRIDRFVHFMRNKRNGIYGNYLSPSSWFYKFLDIGIAVNTAKKNIATHIVLADWNISQYRIMLRIARILDKMQSKDAIDISSGITLHVIGQLFCPSLLPKIKVNILETYYQDILRINQPHYHCIYEKRNEIFANSIANCKGNKIIAVFGHSHIAPICKLLTGEKQLNNPFYTLGSHNIQF